MKKLMIPFAVGLAIGLAATSVFVGFLKGGGPSLTESLDAAVADSAHAEPAGVHGDSAALAAADSGAHTVIDSLGAHALVPSGGVKVADTTAVGPGSHMPADNVTISPAALTSSSSSAPSASGPSMETAQLAKLFASMQPREAARVLDKMDDFEVQVILNQLGNREAAAILGNLSPERAAMISRSVIRGERSSQ